MGARGGGQDECPDFVRSLSRLVAGQSGEGVAVTGRVVHRDVHPGDVVTASPVDISRRPPSMRHGGPPAHATVIVHERHRGAAFLSR